MKLFSTNTCEIPSDLTSVIRAQDEPAELGGMQHEQIQKIWNSVEKLYRTGNHPLISFCLRRQGHILINRSIGHARGNSVHGLANDAVIATPDTPICLFSASKIVTAMLVHLLNEKA